MNPGFNFAAPASGYSSASQESSWDLRGGRAGMSQGFNYATPASDHNWQQQRDLSLVSQEKIHSQSHTDYGWAPGIQRRDFNLGSVPFATPYEPGVNSYRASPNQPSGH